MLLLAGCGGEETFETIADVWAQPVSVQSADIQITLPPEAAAPALESEEGTLYLCQGYEITLQILPAGDLDATVQTISGYSRDSLTVMQTQEGENKRYEMVWVSAGEQGDRVGRAVILDDGNFHYCVSVLADEDAAYSCAESWQEMFDSFSLG